MSSLTEELEVLFVTAFDELNVEVICVVEEVAEEEETFGSGSK